MDPIAIDVELQCLGCLRTVRPPVGPRNMPMKVIRFCRGERSPESRTRDRSELRLSNIAVRFFDFVTGAGQAFFDFMVAHHFYVPITEAETKRLPKFTGLGAVFY